MQGAYALVRGGSSISNLLVISVKLSSINYRYVVPMIPPGTDMPSGFEIDVTDPMLYDACDVRLYCEASQLHRIPPLSLDPVAEQVHSNSQALNALSSVIEGLENKLSTFLVPCASPAAACGARPAVSYATVASSAPTLVATHSSSVISRKSTLQRSSSADDGSSNIILFGLLEGKSLVYRVQGGC